MAPLHVALRPLHTITSRVGFLIARHRRGANTNDSLHKYNIKMIYNKTKLNDTYLNSKYFCFPIISILLKFIGNKIPRSTDAP